GESNGGYMTQRLAQEQADRFAAVAPVISLMPADNKCQSNDTAIPIMYQVGRDDEAIHYQGGETGASGSNLSATDSVDYWIARNQCATTSTSEQLASSVTS